MDDERPAARCSDTAHLIEETRLDAENRLPRGEDALDDEGEGDANEYIALSSYGDGYDFYGSSIEAPPPYGSHPLFTRGVLIFLITSFVVRPACCVLFFVYRGATGNGAFFTLGVTTTVSFYITLLLQGYFMYRNIRLDMMPLGLIQRCLVGLLSVIGPAVFVSMTYVKMFTGTEFFGPVFNNNGPGRAEDAAKIEILTCFVMLSTVVYVIISVSDALGFFIPRLWSRAVMKTCVPF
uniref:Egress protein UL20 n=1 Tax=Anatid alphaherpesvirus 2 TaxID=3080522 RepID=A0AAU0K6S3_9ALPH